MRFGQSVIITRNMKMSGKKYMKETIVYALCNRGYAKRNRTER